MTPVAPELPLAVAVLLPLFAAPLVYVWQSRMRAALILATTSAVLLSTLTLLARPPVSGAMSYTVAGWPVPLGIAWRVDALTALMLATVAMVTLPVAGYCLREPSAAGHGQAVRSFWPLLLFLLASLNALFVSGDIFNLYVTLELVSLASVAMVTLAGSRVALQASMRYLLIVLVGSLCYLLGVALLYAEFGALDLVVLSERVQPTAAVRLSFVLMTVGLAAKTALFPLHVWLPAAHGSAPTAASALLSALVVMAAFYCLLRLWTGVFAEVITPSVALLLGVLGCSGVLWGSWVALCQQRMKMLVAYSTVAQFGYLLLIPSLLQGGGRTALAGGIYLLLSHAFAKAAMFLSAGLILHARGHDRLQDLQGIGHRMPMAVFAMGLAGLTLMGLPPSGGFVAKWLLLEASLQSGQWWWIPVLIVGGLLAAGYMFTILNRAFQTREGIHGFNPPPPLLEWLCLLLAVISMLLGLVAVPVLGMLASDFGGGGP